MITLCVTVLHQKINIFLYSQGKGPFDYKWSKYVSQIYVLFSVGSEEFWVIKQIENIDISKINVG